MSPSAIADGVCTQDIGLAFYVRNTLDLLFEYQKNLYLSIGSCFSGPNGEILEIRKQQGLVTN
jgi:hypothetical protein